MCLVVIGTSEFYVVFVCAYIDEKLFSTSSLTKWMRRVPIELNILAWHISLNKLPTRVNMDRVRIFLPYYVLFVPVDLRRLVILFLRVHLQNHYWLVVMLDIESYGDG